MTEKQGVHFWVSGRVQGVSYRLFTREQALRFGISGWVRNLADGRVEILAFGTGRSVADFFQVLRQGPKGSWVSGIAQESTIIDAATVEQYADFAIHH